MIAGRPGSAYAVALAALAAVVCTHLLDFGLDGLRAGLFDASREWSWSHVLATVAFASGAAISAFAARRRRRAHARAWWALAGLFGVLLIDNVTRAHEAVAAWPLILLPALGGVAVGVAVLARGTPASRAARVALALLTASFAVHVLGHALVHAAGWGPETWGYQIKVALKEGTELAGWVLLTAVLVRLARGARRCPHNGWGAHWSGMDRALPSSSVATLGAVNSVPATKRISGP